MEYYTPSGTCSREILFEVDENNIITKLEFTGGCKGNLQGVSKLAVGMKIHDVIDRLKGIQCRGGTSCPDQLSRALTEYLNAK